VLKACFALNRSVHTWRRRRNRLLHLGVHDDASRVVGFVERCRRENLCLHLVSDLASAVLYVHTAVSVRSRPLIGISLLLAFTLITRLPQNGETADKPFVAILFIVKLGVLDLFAEKLHFALELTNVYFAALNLLGKVVNFAGEFIFFDFEVAFIVSNLPQLLLRLNQRSFQQPLTIRSFCLQLRELGLEFAEIILELLVGRLRLVELFRNLVF